MAHTLKRRTTCKSSKTMAIYLGNLSLQRLAKEHQFEISDEDVAKLQPFHQDNADVKAGKKEFHIFDIPRVIHCGTMEMAQMLYDVLKKYDIKGRLSINVVN